MQKVESFNAISIHDAFFRKLAIFLDFRASNFTKPFGYKWGRENPSIYLIKGNKE